MLLSALFLILIEQASPGLTPSVKFAYVTSYDDHLALRDTLLTYPLLQAPGAAIADGDGLILAEGAQLVRHDELGVATKIGAPLDAAPTVMAFGERHDLFVAFRNGIERVNAVSGAVIRRIDLGEPDYPPADFDLDVGGCVAFIAFDNRLARIDLCAAVPRLETIAADGWFSAVRVLPDGTLLVGARGSLERRGRDGALLRRYDVPAVKLALDTAGATAIAFADLQLRRVDLVTGNVVAGPVQQQRGVSVRSMTVNGEWRAANPRRRRAAHR